MGAEANLATLQSAYANWHGTRGGNVDEIMAMFDDRIEMHSALSDDIPDAVAGSHIHREQAASYFEGLLRDWEMLFYHVERFIVGENGNEIVMVGRCGWRNRTTGREIDIPKIDVHTFNAEGKVVRFQESYDTLAFARALGVA